MKNITWKRGENGLYGFVGKIRLFAIWYDACQPQNAPNKYALGCRLDEPEGVKFSHLTTEQEAKNKAEKILKIIIKELTQHKSKHP